MHPQPGTRTINHLANTQPEPGAPEATAAIPANPRGHETDVKPYGLFGLCLSIIVILLLATLYTGIATTLVYAVLSGWGHLTNLLQHAVSSLAAGDVLTCAGLFIAAAVSHLSYVAISLFVYVALSLAVVTLAGFHGGRAWRSLIAWQPWSPVKASRIYWIVTAAALLYSFAANALIAYYYPPSKDWFVVPHDNLWASVQLFVLAAVFAPVAEELLFRGWIYTSVKARLGFWAALLISSAIFAGLHYEDTHIYALAVFPIGLALGFLRETSGSLKASISFHALFNAVAFGLAAFNIG